MRLATGRLLGILLLILLAACGERDELPRAKSLLDKGAKAMSEVSSVRFTLDVDGTLSGLQVKEASGAINDRGDATATAQVLVAEQLSEYEVVVAGGTTYLKGPTGGFKPLPPALASRLYDPSRLLHPETGLPKTMSGASDARTEAAEKIAGVQTYRIRANIGTDLMQGLSLISSQQESLPATLWVEQKSGRLVRARVRFKVTRSRKETTLTLGLSDFNKPVSITPPQT